MNKGENCGDNVDEVWKEAYRTLGKDDENDTKFNKEFRARVIENQEMIFEQSFAPDNVCAIWMCPLNLRK